MSRRSTILLAGLAAAALLMSLSVPLAALFRSDEQRMREARALVGQGHLRDAEAMLEPLVASLHPGAEASLLYGDVLLKRGQLHKARALFSTQAGPDSLYPIAALSNLALTHFYLGHLDSAATFARRLATQARTQRDTLGLGQALHLLGRIDFNQAQYDSAHARQRRSLALAQHVGSLALEADALRQLGVLSWYRAQHDSALTAFYEPALARYRQVGDKAGEATTLSNIGLLYNEWEDWETYIRYQLHAFGIRKRIGDQIGLADSYYFLANLPHWKAHRRRTFAYTYLLKSHALSERIGYAWGREVAAAALRNALAEDPFLIEQAERWRDTATPRSQEGQILAWAFEACEQAQAGNLAASARQFERLIHVIDSLGYNIGKPGFLAWYGNTLTQLEAFEDAEQALLRARNLAAGERHHRQQVFADLGLARLYLKTQRPRQAEALLTPLVAFYDSLYLQKIHASNVRVAFENAAATVHRTRAHLYSLLVEALAQQSDQRVFATIERERSLPFWGERETVPEAVDQTDAQRAFDRFIGLLETYDAQPERFDDTRPLFDALGETYQALLAQQGALAAAADASLPSVPGIASLQASLRPGEVLLEYFVGVDLSPHDPPSLSVFVARRDTAALIPLSATEPELNILVDVYRRALLLGKTRPDDDVWQGPAYTLYTALLAPVVDNGMLQAGDHVIIAPHRILHVLPFHALTTTAPADSPRFFMEHHLVSYTPSAAYLVEVRKQPPRPLRTMLAAAPDGRTLLYAETEIKRIPDGLFARTKRLRETDATADEVLYAPRAYDVVHLAAHARMNLRHPLYSYLQSADRRLALHEILRQRFRARLVVLSACETGRGVGALGAVPAGEDLVSFPRAFMEAGVTSVVASLWLVEDEATATLMEQFYKAWKDSPEATSLVQALNRAQRRVLAEARHANHKAHPFYWAGFYLTGDSR